MLTIGKPNNQQNKFSLGKETPCRGFLHYSTLRRSRLLLCFLLLLQSFFSLILLTPLLELRHFLLIIEKLGDDRLVHTDYFQNLMLGDLGATAVSAHRIIKPKTRHTQKPFPSVYLSQSINPFRHRHGGERPLVFALQESAQLHLPSVLCYTREERNGRSFRS